MQLVEKCKEIATKDCTCRERRGANLKGTGISRTVPALPGWAVCSGGEREARAAGAINICSMHAYHTRGAKQGHEPLGVVLVLRVVCSRNENRLCTGKRERRDLSRVSVDPRVLFALVNWVCQSGILVGIYASQATVWAPKITFLTYRLNFLGGRQEGGYSNIIYAILRLCSDI